VVEYLQDPPDRKTIESLLKKLGIGAKDLIRRKEHKALGLPETDDQSELIDRMVAHPQIIERPIVVTGTKARLGRPPENVLEIL
jgi:arsenate reductase